jgi:hypothetical protein
VVLVEKYGMPPEFVVPETVAGNAKPVPLNVQVVDVQLTPEPVKVNAPVTVLIEVTPPPPDPPARAVVSIGLTCMLTLVPPVHEAVTKNFV